MSAARWASLAVLCVFSYTLSAGQENRPASPGEALPVELSVNAVTASRGNRLAGDLRIQVDLASIALALEEGPPGRLRASIAVEEPGGRVHVRRLDASLPQGGSGVLWIRDVRIEWPRAAKKLSVLVEEAVTSTRGFAALELPRPAGEKSPQGFPTTGTSSSVRVRPAATGSGPALPAADAPAPVLSIRAETGGAPAAEWRPSDEIVLVIDPEPILPKVAETGSAWVRVVVTAEKSKTPELSQTEIFRQEFGIPFEDVQAWRIKLPRLPRAPGAVRLRVTVEELRTHAHGVVTLPIARPS